MVQELVLGIIHLSDVCGRFIETSPDADDHQRDADDVEYRLRTLEPFIGRFLMLW